MTVIALVAAVALAVIGVVLLLTSPTMGSAAADAWLFSLGGSVDTAKFQAMLSGYMEAYRLLGAVLLGGGILGAFQQMRGTSR